MLDTEVKVFRLQISDGERVGGVFISLLKREIIMGFPWRGQKKEWEWDWQSINQSLLLADAYSSLFRWADTEFSNIEETFWFLQPPPVPLHGNFGHTTPGVGNVFQLWARLTNPRLEVARKAGTRMLPPPLASPATQGKHQQVVLLSPTAWREHLHSGWSPTSAGQIQRFHRSDPACRLLTPVLHSRERSESKIFFV